MTSRRPVFSLTGDLPKSDLKVVLPVFTVQLRRVMRNRS